MRQTPFQKHWPLVLFLALPLTARVIFCRDIWLGSLSGDALDYYNIALNLIDHGYFGRGPIPDASRPPLYPLLLGWVCKLLELRPTETVYSYLNLVLDAISLGLLWTIG